MTLRILHISTRLILGGSQENTLLSCEGQARRGHQVHLAHGPIYGAEGSLLQRLRRFNAELAPPAEPDAIGSEPARPLPISAHQLPRLVRDINPLKDWLSLRDLRALIRDVRPHVVHTHSSKAGILGRTAAWPERHKNPATPNRPDGGIAIVHTIHGPPFHRSLPSWKNTLYAAAERFAARRCHVLVSVADAMTDQYLDRRIGNPEQYVTVRSGMEVERYLHADPGEGREEVRRDLGLMPDDFVIGTVARLAEHKGHDDLLDALADELRTRPAWKLLWVGDGWWRTRLLRRVNDMGLQGRVLMTGLVPQERVAPMMRAMDLLVHPSHREGLPRTVPQALLCGTPVVASDADGTPEVCIDWKTGRLYPVADVTRLREAVLWMADHPEERRAMTARGMAACREEFSADRMVERLEEVYARALAQSTESRAH